MGMNIIQRGVNLLGRTDPVRGGGVALYVREHLNVQEIPEIDQLMPSEDIGIKVFGKKMGGGLHIGVCYGPPASDRGVNTMLVSQRGEAIVMGDFSYPNINWNLVTGHGKSGEEFFL